MGKQPSAPASARGSSFVTVPVSIPTDIFEVNAPAPEYISQRNVDALFGIDPERYLVLTRAQWFPLKVIPLGKLRLVERAPFVAYLKTLAMRAERGEGETDGEQKAGEFDPKEYEEEVLRELGYRPVLGARSESKGQITRRRA